MPPAYVLHDADDGMLLAQFTSPEQFGMTATLEQQSGPMAPVLRALARRGFVFTPFVHRHEFPNGVVSENLIELDPASIPGQSADPSPCTEPAPKAGC